MSAVESRLQESAPDSLASVLVARLAGLFSRLPMLSGFSVQERWTLSPEREGARLDEELSVADVSLDFGPSLHATSLFADEIADVLLDLLEEHPVARQLLRGHTFARTFH